MRSLRYLNTILTLLTVLLAMQLWTTWMTPSASGNAAGLASPALAQAAGGGIPDAGAQRKEMIDLLKRHIQQTDELIGLLKSGQVRVKVEAPAKDGK